MRTTFSYANDGKSFAFYCVFLKAIMQEMSYEPSVAKRLYREACFSGSSLGCEGAGRVQLGIGTPKELKHAKEMLRRACQGGRSWACDQL